MSEDLRTPATLPGIPHQRRRPDPERPDPIDELARELDTFVSAAVHPDEVAALLESDGLSDDQIRERYGVLNSFALAEELYDRIPRRHPEPEGTPADPWRAGLLGCLLRGLVFALPGFAYVLGAPLLAGPRDAFDLPAGTLTLLASALCGWAWNQGLAHRAYAWLGLGDRPAARRCLLVGTPAGMLLGALAALPVGGAAHPAAAAFAAGQSCYLGASGVLLVMGRERALLAALTPLTAGALLALAHPLPDQPRLLLLVTSTAAVATLGFLEVAPALRRPGAGPRTARPTAPRPTGHWPAGLTALLPFGRLGAPPTPSRTPESCAAPRPGPFVRRWAGVLAAPVTALLPAVRPVRGGGPGPRLLSSLPYAVFGLGSGVLVLYAGLGDVLTGAERSAVAAPEAVALTLSMGPAEWLLYRFRSGGLAALRASGTARTFRRTLGRTLARCLFGYLAALLVLAVVAAASWPHSPLPTGVRLAGLLALGVVLWTGLLLQSFGAVLGAAAVCCAAALAQTLALLTHAGDPRLVGLAVYAAAATVQVALARGLLGRATAHR
ncbi:hypothetical protein OIB37_10835 [Streptomyces sp. NBC_00820]|uniref:hypothetical protein n=1 Tax=Streptomyces sp. NBC_00820 TaxID=2975842 RepID=UPI002ED1AF83|nr:hypothetical protein OIB37_10835 [Streptomyces sp. NBC_00820]